MSVGATKPSVTFHIGTEIAAQGTEGIIDTLVKAGIDGAALHAAKSEIDAFVTSGISPQGLDMEANGGKLELLFDQRAIIALLGKDGFIHNSNPADDTYMMNNDPLGYVQRLTARLERDTHVHYDEVSAVPVEDAPQFVFCSVSNPHSV